MDLTISINNEVLNIRAGIILETINGFIFERQIHEKFYFVVGGRVTIGESSENAIKRELKEELGIILENVKLKAIVENFFVMENKKFHEICFYYKEKIDLNVNLPKNFFAFSKDKIHSLNILPTFISDLIHSETNEIIHIIQ